MDNASKALIIAGAILIALLIIEVGVYLYNSASNTITDSIAQLDTLEVIAYNQQFENYMNRTISGNQVKDFLRNVISNNTSDKDSRILVNAYDIVSGNPKFTHKYTKKDINKMINSISDTSSYTITITNGCKTYTSGHGYKNNGCIGCVSIRKK